MRACQSLTKRASTRVRERGAAPRRLPSRGSLVRANQLAVLPDRQEAALSPQRLVVVWRVRPRFHLGGRVAEVADLLERVADLLRVRPDAVARPQHKARAVIGLRRRHRVEVAALVLEALLDLGVELLGVLA